MKTIKKPESLEHVLNAADLFWSKVNKTDDCWIYQGTIHHEGYGMQRIKGRYYLAHRVGYMLAKKKLIPHGLLLNHLCRTRVCVNSDHLEVTTNRENLLAGLGVGAINTHKTHCVAGHPFDDVNSYTSIAKNGRTKRHCRACISTRDKAYYAKKLLDSTRPQENL